MKNEKELNDWIDTAERAALLTDNPNDFDKGILYCLGKLKEFLKKE